MVSPATQMNRPFFECSQPWCGLACIENGGRCISDCGAKFRRQRGDAGESLKEIDRDALRHQQRPHIASYHDDLRTGLDGGSVVDGLDDAQRGVHSEEDFARDGHACNGYGLMGDDGGPSLNGTGKQRTRGHVAVVQVFGEGLLNRFTDGLRVRSFDFGSAH